MYTSQSMDTWNVPIRALIDTSVEANNITNTIAKNLGFSHIPCNTQLNTVNEPPTLVCRVAHGEGNTPFSM